jgi:hypothetical protein
MNILLIKDYYGKTLQGSRDLKTTASRTPGNMPERDKGLLANIMKKFWPNITVAVSSFQSCWKVGGVKRRLRFWGATSMRSRSSSASRATCAASI